MAEFLTEFNTTKGKGTWVVANTKDLLPAEIQTIIDSVSQIQTSLDAYWLVQKAEMILANAEAVAVTGISALNLVKEIYNSLIGVIANLIDLSFFELFIPPEKGGLPKYIRSFQYHLFDTTDPNRPADDGNAYLLPVFMLVSFKDITRAQEAYENIQNLWGKFKTEGDKLIKDMQASLLGYVPDPSATEPNGFWKHYYQKRLVGTREKPKNRVAWSKKNVFGFFPQEAMLQLQNMLDSWQATADGASKYTDLIERTQSTMDFILQIVEEVSIALDAYSRLFTDTQVSVISLPGVSGEAVTNNKDYKLNADIYKIMRPSSYSGKKTAVEVLSEYVTTLPQTLKDASKELEQKKYNLGFSEQEQLYLNSEVRVENPFKATGDKNNYANFLREDYCVGGIAFLFKGPSLSLLEIQVESFFSIFGLK